jgi:hypothetical protein
MTSSHHACRTLLLAALAGCSVEKNLLTVGEDTSSGTATTTQTTGDSTSTTGDPTTTTGDSTTGDASTTASTLASTTASTTDLSTTDASTGTTPDLGGSGPFFDLGSNPGADLGGADEFASVDRTCAPNDGPAVEFRLRLAANVCGADALTDLRVDIYQPAPLSVGTHALADGGHWTLFENGNVVDSGDSGTIVIDAWDGDSVSFHYDLGGQTGAVVGAPFCDTQPMCG